MKKKIFVWDNTGTPNWHVGVAICEDGHVLAGHCSSSVSYLKLDMGLFPDRCKWKHDHYYEHCPDGYELEFVENPKDHEGLSAALLLNEKLPGKPEDAGPFVSIEMSNP